MYDEIQPIPTTYNGIRFRSKLEAQWAVYLEAMEIPYEYESKTFPLVGTVYTPDFQIEDDIFLEIKPAVFTYGSLQKMVNTASGHNVNIALCAGDFYDGFSIALICPTREIFFDYGFRYCPDCNTTILTQRYFCPKCNSTLAFLGDNLEYVRQHRFE